MTTTGRSTPALRRLYLRRVVPYALLVVACALSVMASRYIFTTARATEDAQARSAFLINAQQTRRQIENRLSSYIEVVRAGAVLLSADNEINGVDFRRFVAGLKLPERFPGVGGIGFAECVRRRDLGRFLRLMDLDGNPIRVWPREVRARYCPTVFLAPGNARHTEALGFDLASVQVIAEAMAMARDSGEPMVSRDLGDVPVWKGEPPSNLVLLLPVYRLAATPRSVDARRRAIVGFVLSPFNFERLLQDIVTPAQSSLAIAVYDGTVATPATMLGAVRTPLERGDYESSEVVGVAGRDWLIAATSRHDPSAVVPQAARQALVGGFVLSILLFTVTRAQVRAWETAALHEAELRASEQALRQSEAGAHAANRAKDAFLATVSHELRTPLNVVLGWVAILRDGKVPAERVPSALDVIERNARQQARLIEDLLDVSRIVAGHLRLDRRSVALAPIVGTTVESLRPTADHKKVAISVRCDNDAMIHGDADRLRQTIWNLVDNAIKFTPEGGAVSVELTVDADKVALVVSDTGIGITPEFLPHVFERFRQADSTTTRAHSGLGLGLAITEHLVGLQGGAIRVESQGTGQGATMIVEFPGITADAELSPDAGGVRDRAEAPPLTGVRVLVVEDDPSTRELVAHALSTSGAEVTEAGSARDALHQLQQHGTDVIVSDIAMPHEDGVWFLQQVRKLPDARARTPAIAVTALARSEDRRRVMNAGYEMHLEKPVDLHVLQRGIATLAGAPRTNTGPDAAPAAMFPQL